MGIEEKLYNTVIGRMILKPLISEPVSRLSGCILDTRLSRCLIKPFVRSAGINPADYILTDINCFNDFFRRKIRSELRPVDMSDDNLIAPCDGLLKVIRINDGAVIPAKQSKFTVRSLLRDSRLANHYEGGLCFVYRLCVEHYHRYIYFESGTRYPNRAIKGFYHTVRPAALRDYPVFVENTREYSVIDTKNFGRCVQMEVGAMLVGRIVNHKKSRGGILRGEEKGYFEYGASTVIVLIPKEKVSLRPDIKKAMGTDLEISVKMGEVIGVKR